jgi:hypothetical protein
VWPYWITFRLQLCQPPLFSVFFRSSCYIRWFMLACAFFSEFRSFPLFVTYTGATWFSSVIYMQAMHILIV